MKKIAVFSIDVEDWYHLDYFKNYECDKNQTLIKEGLINYLSLIKDENIKSTLFLVGETIDMVSKILKNYDKKNIEISAHSYNHIKPLDQTLNEFEEDTIKVFNKIKKTFGISPLGYRAPCFSIDYERYCLLKKLNFNYDSSKIDVDIHPLYGKLDLKNSYEIKKNIHIDDDFFEFQLPTLSFFKKNIPISGGGYLRIFPWFIFKYFLKKYLNNNNTFFFYIHPYEMTDKKIFLPKNIDILNKFRFSYGRKTTLKKTKKLIRILKNDGYKFITFKELIENLLENDKK